MKKLLEDYKKLPDMPTNLTIKRAKEEVKRIDDQWKKALALMEETIIDE